MEGEEEDQKQNSVDDQSEDYYDQEHDEHEEKYLEVDHQLMFLQPFLIPHVIANCIFAADIASIGLAIGTIAIFFIFNVKGTCHTQKWTSVLFVIPSLLGFMPIFYNDHQMAP